MLDSCEADEEEDEDEEEEEEEEDGEEEEEVVSAASFVASFMSLRSLISSSKEGSSFAS